MLQSTLIARVYAPAGKTHLSSMCYHFAVNHPITVPIICQRNYPRRPSALLFHAYTFYEYNCMFMSIFLIIISRTISEFTIKPQIWSKKYAHVKIYSTLRVNSTTDFGTTTMFSFCMFAVTNTNTQTTYCWKLLVIFKNNSWSSDKG